MIHTRICEILGIEYPILQGAWHGWQPLNWRRRCLMRGSWNNRCRKRSRGRGGKGNNKGLEAYNKTLWCKCNAAFPFVEQVMEVILKYRVRVVTTGAGNPGKYIGSLKEAGAKIIPVVPSVALAKRMQSVGADALIAEGTEAGGHIGELTTMCLVPQVVDAVEIPVIAAGGIADGRGLVAVLALGAEGVQMGTRFVCSLECTAHANYKEALLKAGDRDTVASGRTTGHPVRCLKNKLTREFDRLERAGATAGELEKLGAGKLREAVVEGNTRDGSVMSGQIAGLINDIKPVKEIIEGITKEARDIIEITAKVLGR